MNIKVIITGATGMVGEGVLMECLAHPQVSEVLLINRKASGYKHPKLKEIIHADFFDLSPIKNQLQGYNTCLFCLGVTSIGKNEAEFYKYTYTLTLHVAGILSEMNKDMTFCYISGAGTDSSEKGKQMWARVKGKTENDLAKLPFKKVFAVRPGMLKPTKLQKNVLSSYKYFGWLYPILRTFAPKYVSTIKELGLAMIYVSIHGYEKTILEVVDIVKLGNK